MVCLYFFFGSGAEERPSVRRFSGINLSSKFSDNYLALVSIREFPYDNLAK